VQFKTIGDSEYYKPSGYMNAYAD